VTLYATEILDHLVKMKLLYVCLVYSVLHVATCEMDRQAMTRLVRKVNNDNYLKEMRPGMPWQYDESASPINVNVNTYIRGITGLDTEKGRLKLQLTFRQSWTDERLESVCADAQGDGACAALMGKDVEKLWMPDTFFRNEIESHIHQDLVQNNYIRVMPGGEVLHSVRVTVEAFCPAAIGAETGDEVECVVQIASYGWSKNDMIYMWKEENPVQYREEEDAIAEVIPENCDVVTSTAEYSCLAIHIKMVVDKDGKPHY